MSNEPGETSTDPIAQRIVLANEAAAILNKSRRPSPFTGQTPLLADEIIALAEYLRLGDASFVESDDESDEFVDPMTLRIGDVVILNSSIRYAIVGPPRLTGGLVDLKVRPEHGGIAYLKSVSVDSTIRLISRVLESEVDPNSAKIFVGMLDVDDVILDFGDGPIETEKVTKVMRPKYGTIVEITTIDPRLDQEIQADVTRSLPVDHQVVVRLPRP